MAGTMNVRVKTVDQVAVVSMESGLDGRNNSCPPSTLMGPAPGRLNGVRPRWPEQWVRFG